LKGTSYIEKAIAELIEMGYPIDFLLIEGKSYEEALALYVEGRYSH